MAVYLPPCPIRGRGLTLRDPLLSAESAPTRSAVTIMLVLTIFEFPVPKGELLSVRRGVAFGCECNVGVYRSRRLILI